MGLARARVRTQGPSATPLGPQSARSPLSESRAGEVRHRVLGRPRPPPSGLIQPCVRPAGSARNRTVGPQDTGRPAARARLGLEALQGHQETRVGNSGVCHGPRGHPPLGRHAGARCWTQQAARRAPLGYLTAHLAEGAACWLDRAVPTARRSRVHTGRGKPSARALLPQPKLRRHNGRRPAPSKAEAHATPPRLRLLICEMGRYHHLPQSMLGDSRAGT